MLVAEAAASLKLSGAKNSKFGLQQLNSTEQNTTELRGEEREQ